MLSKIIAFIVLPITLSAAGQITHLYFAEQYLKHHPEWDVSQFIRGTLFPDIRHLAKLARNDTHQPGDFNTIAKAPSAFEAGVRFHWYVDTCSFPYYCRDEHTEELLQSNELKALRAQFSNALWPLILKFAHNEVLLNLADTSSALTCLDGIPQTERELSIQPEALQAWHDFLRLELTISPGQNLHQLLIPPGYNLGLSDDAISKIQETIATLSRHSDFIAHIKKINDCIRLD